MSQKLAQSFESSISTTIAYVRLRLRRVGSPVGNLTAKLYTDIQPAIQWRLGVVGFSELGRNTYLSAETSLPNALITNGTSNTRAAAGVATSWQWVRFAFPTPPDITGGRKTWIVLEHTGTFDGSNKIQWGADGSSPTYAGGEMVGWDGSQWVSLNQCGIFEVYGGE